MLACMRAIATAAFLFPGLWLGIPAGAHDAPSGWPYPGTCCGGLDCAPLEAGDLRFTLTGDGEPAWLVVATGEVIPAEEARHSPDRMNHRCVYLSGEKEGLTRRAVVNGELRWCLWTAEGSF